MHSSSRLLALLASLVFGVTFFATTLVLAYEFWDDSRWIDFLAIDSHLFLFFPIFGVIALVAFYLPGAALVDFYWHHMRWGRSRFFAGLAIATAASWLIAAFLLTSANKPVWEIEPGKLNGDKGEAGVRLSILSATRSLRNVSLSRGSLKPFVRHCFSDALIDREVQVGPKRFCIASTPFSPRPELLSDADCCKAQRALTKAVNDLQAQPWNGTIQGFLLGPLRIVHRLKGAPVSSLTGDVHALLLPIKVFFLLTLLAISLFLTLQFTRFRTHYLEWLPGIEAGVLIGTCAVLFFPLMSQAFLFANEALVGDAGLGFFSRLVPVLSLLFGIWTLLILLFFFRGRNKETEIASKILGAAVGIVTLIQYEAIVGFLVQALGAGAPWPVLAAMFVCGVGFAIGTKWVIDKQNTSGTITLVDGS